MATKETLGPNPFQQLVHPPTSEGDLLSESNAVVVSLNPENRVYVVSDEIQVGNSRGYFKAFFPEHRTEPGFGVFFSGFMGIVKSSEPFGAAWASQGLANVLVGVDRTSGSANEDWQDPHKLTVVTAGEIMHTLRNDNRVKNDVPEGTQAVNEQQIVAAHSMGGLSSTLYAEEHSEEVEMLALIETVGVNLSIAKLMVKSLFNGNTFGSRRHEFGRMRQNGDIEFDRRTIFRTLHYLGVPIPGMGKTSPIRTAGEMRSCLTADTRPLLKHIGELGVKILGIEGGRDTLVRWHPDIHDYLHAYVFFEKYGHLLPQCRADLVAQTILQKRAELALEAV